MGKASNISLVELLDAYDRATTIVCKERGYSPEPFSHHRYVVETLLGDETAAPTPRIFYSDPTLQDAPIREDRVAPCNLSDLERGLLTEISVRSSRWREDLRGKLHPEKVTYHHSARAFELKELYLELLKQYDQQRIRRCAQLALNKVPGSQRTSYDKIEEKPTDATIEILEKPYPLAGESPFRKGLTRTLHTMVKKGALAIYFERDWNKYLFTVARSLLTEEPIEASAPKA